MDDDGDDLVAMKMMMMKMIMLPPVRSYLDRSRHDGKVDQS